MPQRHEELLAGKRVVGTRADAVACAATSPFVFAERRATVRDFSAWQDIRFDHDHDDVAARVSVSQTTACQTSCINNTIPYHLVFLQMLHSLLFVMRSHECDSDMASTQCCPSRTVPSSVLLDADLILSKSIMQVLGTEKS
jgi:hypothetical protein